MSTTSRKRKPDTAKRVPKATASKRKAVKVEEPEEAETPVREEDTPVKEEVAEVEEPEEETPALEEETPVKEEEEKDTYDCTTAPREEVTPVRLPRQTIIRTSTILLSHYIWKAFRAADPELEITPNIVSHISLTRQSSNWRSCFARSSARRASGRYLPTSPTRAPPTRRRSP